MVKQAMQPQNMSQQFRVAPGSVGSSIHASSIASPSVSLIFKGGTDLVPDQSE